MFVSQLPLTSHITLGKGLKFPGEREREGGNEGGREGGREGREID